MLCHKLIERHRTIFVLSICRRSLVYCANVFRFTHFLCHLSDIFKTFLLHVAACVHQWTLYTPSFKVHREINFG